MADPLASLDAARDAYLRDVRAMMAKAVDEAAKLLLAEMKLLTARIDHDLNQLRKLDHPYAWRNPPNEPHADWIVHLQSGELQGGLKALPPEVRRLQVSADLLSESRHTWFVILGTRKMRPRDFVSAAMIMREEDVKAILLRNFLAVHDRTAGSPLVSPLSLELMPHEEFPAQLPGGE